MRSFHFRPVWDLKTERNCATFHQAPGVTWYPWHGSCLGHLQEGRDLDRPRKPLGAIEGVGDSQHFHSSEKGMEVREEKAEGPESISQLGQEIHEKVAVWAIPGTPLELRHLEGARVERYCTQNQHDTHLRPDAWFYPPIAKMFHQPTPPPPPPLPAKLR